MKRFFRRLFCGMPLLVLGLILLGCTPTGVLDPTGKSFVCGPLGELAEQAILAEAQGLGAAAIDALKAFYAQQCNAAGAAGMSQEQAQDAALKATIAYAKTSRQLGVRFEFHGDAGAQ